MKKLISMLALVIVMGLATTSCNEDETNNLKVDGLETTSDTVNGGDGNEGGSGGNNPPPGGN